MSGQIETSKLAANERVSGLQLIQFRAKLTPEWRELLQANGVDLLHYVPDDTFIARFHNVPVAQVRALPFVEWVGDYRPEIKIHRAVKSAAMAKSANATVNLNISVLLAPRSSGAEIADAQKPFISLQQNSTLRSGTVLRGTINAAQLDALSRSPAVLWIEPAPHMKLVDEISSSIVAGEGPPNQLYTQSLGYDGRGVAVAVADSGLDSGDAASMHPDLYGRATNFFYYGSLTDASDGHGHGTHCAGIIAGDGASGETDENGFLWGLGVAPRANIIAQRIFDDAGNFDAPPSFETLTRDATRAGAVIGSNSWGDDTQGRYDISAMEFDELVRDADGLAFGDQPYILEFSAGNAGPGGETIGSPAVAKNVIATGASENDRLDLFIYDDGPDAMADFSSRGPCEDGRIKPDVVAPGTWISSLNSRYATADNGWLPIDDLYQYMGGTSQAGPHVSGAAAVFVQFYRATITNSTPSPALVKAALINSAVDMDDDFGTAPTPNMDEGWGRVDLTQIIGTPRTVEFVDQTTLLQTGQVYEKHVVVGDPSEPLKITLAYTDVPGFPGAIPALVNDLDLEVVAPDGTLYRGNQFNGSESIPNAPNADRINNVEGVYVSQPIAGDYTVRVRAYNVAEDARADTGAVDQDFGLVISGGVAPPGVGVVGVDRRFYRAADQIKIFATDSDLAGNSSVNVTLRSTTEFSGETVTLLAAGSTGVFTGKVATATGPAAPDGVLQISNGDLIEALYFDASLNTIRTATAHADFVPPALSGVSNTSDFGLAVVSWNSDEPATSIVRYGTNLGSLSLAITNSALTTSHSLSLGNVIPGRTYYYYVVSSDEAGNVTTNNNGGSLFSFVVAPTAAVLLVDSYQDPYGVGIPPLSIYTNTLAQLGISYDLWETESRGSPTNVMKSYRVVFWRVSDFVDDWSVADQAAISNYLNSGGSMFVASMEILSRLAEDGGASFIANTLHVQSYLVDGSGSTGAEEIIGSSNEQVGKGIDVFADYSVYETTWDAFIEIGFFPDPPDFSDTMTPDSSASPVLFNDFGDTIGLRWPAIGKSAPGRLVFCTFPLEFIPLNGGTNDSANLLRNVLSFLAPGVGGLNTVAMDSPAYKLPSVVTVEVGDATLAGQGTTSVLAYTTNKATGISVTLQATTEPGVFTGTFNLIPATNSPGPGKLAAANGDTLTVEYTRSNVTVRATATVDTVAPNIGSVSADPDYEQATISWTTSEPADTTVQFGDSQILSRTAFSPSFTVDHSIILPALMPSHTYYYQVVSRDAAGNTTVDDNNGQLYSFTTLTPLSPPWSDNMETGATNWSVISPDESEVQWTLGAPSNGAETNAHSPPSAWGSNLKGAFIDSAESYLISPPVLLNGGNSATLTFWHRYDMDQSDSDLDIYEYGDLLLITNNTLSPVPIAEYTDESGGWVREQIDLTPYMGQVVYVVWDYELLSFDTRVRPGWLVDDVSITVSNIVPGTVSITNNIWQAQYVLSGGLSQQGKGLGTVLTNAPPGQYTIDYADVPYYHTPASQTNTLAAGSTITFTGNYSFDDANTNGIPDAWETNFFGNLSLTRTRFTDSDGDHMSDYAEFVAGTDPNSAASVFKVANVARLPDGNYRVAWPSVPGRGYRVYGSTNLAIWTPVSDWVQAVSTQTTYTFSSPTNGAPYAFRVQVQP